MYNDQSNALGEFIFQSKYARYNSNLKRKETFEESVDRIINYFQNKFGILFKKIGRAIRLTSVRQVELFESFFKEYYHKSMNYKTLQFNKNKYINGKNN